MKGLPRVLTRFASATLRALSCAPEVAVRSFKQLRSGGAPTSRRNLVAHLNPTTKPQAPPLDA